MCAGHPCWSLPPAPLLTPCAALRRPTGHGDPCYCDEGYGSNFEAGAWKPMNNTYMACDAFECPAYSSGTNCVPGQ